MYECATFLPLLAILTSGQHFYHYYPFLRVCHSLPCGAIYTSALRFYQLELFLRFATLLAFLYPVHTIVFNMFNSGLTRQGQN